MVHVHHHFMSSLTAGFIDGNNYVVQQLKRLSADVKEEVAKLDDAVLALAADPHNPGRLTDVQNLESRLASMNEMHKSLVAQLAGATHTDSWAFLPAGVCTAGTCICIRQGHLLGLVRPKLSSSSSCVRLLNKHLGACR